MSHTIVKITIDEYGEKKPNQKWHLAMTACGDSNTLCEGEFFGYGAGTTDFKCKTVEKGGITCPDCLNIIREIKAIKL